MPARHLLVPMILWSLMAPFAVIALGAAPHVDPPDPGGPTAIEQALVERACSMMPAAAAIKPDAHLQCLDARLLSMRADFGRGLSRLSGSERRMLDSVCSRVRTAQGREAYLDCLAAQLVSLHNRRSRANPAAEASEGAALSPPAASDPISPGLQARQEASSRFSLAAGATLATGLVAVGVVVLAVRARRARRTCRVCGAVVPDSGDLCQACRHEAAHVLRRAATERANHKRAQEEEQRRQGEDEEKQRHQKARQDEDERQRLQEEARLREEEARQQQAEEVRQRSQVASSSKDVEEVFDPYTILGVRRQTSREEIRAAYEEARLKYDLDEVAHLGDEVQAHFRAKGQAVERAYQMLVN
jgi:hypothetical protein